MLHAWLKVYTSLHIDIHTKIADKIFFLVHRPRKKKTNFLIKFLDNLAQRILLDLGPFPAMGR